MRAQIKKELKVFHSRLENHLKEYPTNLISIQAAITLSENVLFKLYQIVSTAEFKNKNDEIIFFKVEKPNIHGHFKYLLRLQKYILIRGITSSKGQEKIINAHFKQIRKWFKNEHHFVVYCKLSRKHLDDKYYLRTQCHSYFNPQQKPFLNDPRFATKYSDLKAELLANELLLSFFKKEIKLLKRDVQSYNSKKQMKYLNWTKSKTDLVELIYALKSSQAIQNGDVEIKTLTKYFERLFNKSLGNYYKTYGEIKNRRKEKTPFLNLLQFSLERQILEDNKFT